MSTTVYLDVDDEITSAASRLRSAAEGRVALVVPYGSRLSTSRINFRLLAREAQAHARQLSIVAADGATRALAASAGLPVFSTVGEYEATLSEPAPDDGAGAATVSAPAAPAASAPAVTPHGPSEDLERTVVIERVAPPPIARDGDRPRPGREARPAVDRPSVAPAAAGGRSGRGRMPLVVGAALVALLALVGGVAAYVFLPSATIRLTPRVDAVAPVQFEVTADPTATTTDPAAAIIPAKRLTFAVDASDTFKATGKRVVETKATGEVVFQSYDYKAANTIRAGSIVATEGGTKFATMAAVTLPAASVVFSPGNAQIIPSQRTVGVQAIKAGPGSNVGANSIRLPPTAEDPTFTRVNNPQPTTGGTHDEFPRIDQSDVDAAVEQLTKQLGQQFAERLADPESVPNGMTLFPETQAVADPTPSVDPASLVGKEVETFDLALTAEGTVTAVDEAPLAALAETRIRGAVDAGHRLVEDSIQVATGDPRVDGERVVFPVVGRAEQIPVVDAKGLVAKVKGRSIAEARAILEPYGQVEISAWPDWVTAIPTIDARVSLDVLESEVAPSASPGPSGSPVPSRSAPPSASAGPRGSPAVSPSGAP